MKQKLIITFFAACFLLLGSTAYSLPALPDPIATDYEGDEIIVGSQYGDFYGYSLPLLDYYTDGGSYVPGSDWYVGQPKAPIVIYTNSENVRENPVDMDDAWDSVTGNPTDQLAFNPDDVLVFDPEEDRGDPNSDTFLAPFDQEDSWDSTTSAMIDFLTDDTTDELGDLVLFFNNNQEGGYNATTGEYEQALFGWGQIQLVDTTGVLDTLYFDFNSQSYESNDTDDYTHDGYYDDTGISDPADLYAFHTNPLYPFAGYADPGDLVFSAGDLYVLPGGLGDDPSDDPIYILIRGVQATALGLAEGYYKEARLREYIFGVISALEALGADDVKTLVQLSNNLGRNASEVAITSPELNDVLQHIAMEETGYVGYDVMRIRMQLDFLNNGPEQLFIMANPGEYEYVIPEPATLLLFGLGLIGFAGLGRRKQG